MSFVNSSQKYSFSQRTDLLSMQQPDKQPLVSDSRPYLRCMSVSPAETSPLALLKEYWGHTAFRPGQAEIIDSVLNGHDTLALLPTGGG